MLVAKASMLDRSSQEDVDQFNDIQKKLIDLSSPEKAQESKNVQEEMTGMFNKLFRDGEGKPKPINVKVGDALDQNQEFDNYLSKVNKSKE